MKKLLLLMGLFAALIPNLGYSTQDVHGYYKKNGTYVAPHHRTDPNKTQKDNWSSKGNVNPYTGKKGTKTPKK